MNEIAALELEFTYFEVTVRYASKIFFSKKIYSFQGGEKHVVFFRIPFLNFSQFIIIYLLNISLYKT